MLDDEILMLLEHIGINKFYDIIIGILLLVPILGS